jgi:hypothetical protein
MAKRVRWEEKKGTVQVAVNPDDNLWDLYDASVFVNPQGPALRPVPDLRLAF